MTINTGGLGAGAIDDDIAASFIFIRDGYICSSGVYMAGNLNGTHAIKDTINIVYLAVLCNLIGQGNSGERRIFRENIYTRIALGARLQLTVGYIVFFITVQLFYLILAVGIRFYYVITVDDSLTFILYGNIIYHQIGIGFIFHLYFRIGLGNH